MVLETNYSQIFSLYKLEFYFFVREIKIVDLYNKYFYISVSPSMIYMPVRNIHQKCSYIILNDIIFYITADSPPSPEHFGVSLEAAIRTGSTTLLSLQKIREAQLT